jgi:hypothetical protein
MHINFETHEPVKFEKRGSTREATLALVSLLRLFLQPRDKISLWEIADLYERLPVPTEDSAAVRRPRWPPKAGHRWPPENRPMKD